MATITPAYSWPVPTSVDLVKDGATAIEALGDAIDASMNTALGTKKAGMVLLNTTSFSGVANQSFTNVFNSTYAHYFVTFDFAGDAASNTSFRLRSASTDETGSIYDYFGISGNSNSNTVSAQRANNDSSFPLSRIDVAGATASRTSGYIYFFNPQQTAVTGIKRTANGYDSTPQLAPTDINGNTGTTTTSYDGFSFLGGGSNMTGTVRIYAFTN